jgi:hypothetical protein
MIVLTVMNAKKMETTTIKSCVIDSKKEREQMPYKDDLQAAFARIEQLENELASSKGSKSSTPPKRAKSVWIWLLLPLVVVTLAVLAKHFDSLANNKGLYATLSGDLGFGAVFLGALALIYAAANDFTSR